MTTAPRAESERIVIGTYFSLPLAARSSRRYAPAGHPVVGTVREGRQCVLTIRSAATVGAGCGRPGTAGEVQSSRAPLPPYQPRRKARTVKAPAVEVTNSRND